MSYLITCSSSKRCPESIHSSLANLSFPELNQYRNIIIQLSNITLDWNSTLPAWKLYSGNYSKLYPQVSEENWTNVNTDVKILSALFGWIKHTDMIPYYDLQMTQIVVGERRSIKNIWQSFNVLQNYVNENDIDLLSGVYKQAINKRGIIIAHRPLGIMFTDRGVQKGRWLNSQLM